MNFTEWCQQTAKELGYGYSKDIVIKVMLMAIRVALEEFGANPVQANLTLYGIGKFYMNHRKYYHNVKYTKDQPKEVYMLKEGFHAIWEMRFIAGQPVKDLINGRKKITELKCNGYYLYPEYLNEQQINNKEIKIPKEQEIRHPNDYWIRKINLMKKGVLDFVNNEWVKTGFSVEEWEKAQIDKKRGRPCNKLTSEQVRNKVMTEMRRDLRRELRQFRKGEITEDELRMAKW